MDNMKNGKIGGGLTLDECINIRQQGAKNVGDVEIVGKAGTRLFPGGGLTVQEAAGGHLLKKHVGQTTEALAQRLVNEPRIGTASTFLSRAEAEAAMSGLYDANAARISSWVSSGANGRITITGSFNGGAVLPRGAMSTSTGTGSIAVLQGNGNGGWYLLTGYPIIP